MAKETFQKGSKPVIRVSFTDPDNDDAALDPTTVTIAIHAPEDAAGEATTYTYATDVEVEKESVGNYAFRLLLDQEGTYHWKWTGATSSKQVVLAGSCDSVQEVDF